MKFGALKEGRLLKRYKRFLADIELKTGETITAHCANPGSMMGVSDPGSRVWVSRSASKTRKLPYSWELLETPTSLVAINTSNPNKIVWEAVEAARIPALTGYSEIRREAAYGEASRIDILLSGEDKPPCFVEIKNVHLVREPTLAEFPDSVTARGAKHLRELSGVVRDGGRAVMLFVVQRSDCQRFAPARDLDDNYARALDDAANSGVEIMCYDCDVTLAGVALRKPLPVSL